MASTHLGNVKIKVGQWTDPRDGQVKGRNRSIGKLMQGDDGRHFIIVNAEALSTQLFALARKKGEDSVILNVWPDDPKQGTAFASAPAADEDDGIPYNH
jgi:hypothetical protein